MKFGALHNSCAYLLYSDSKIGPKSAKFSRGCGTESLRSFSSRQMQRDALCTNKHCLQLPMQDWTSSQHISKVNPHANITKIDCVQRCNLYSFAKEAEHVTLECIIYYLAFWLLFSANIKLSVIYVLLTTYEANRESTPTSYMQDIFGPGHRVHPAVGLLLQTSLPLQNHWGLHLLAFRTDQMACFSGFVFKISHMYFTEWLIWLNGWGQAYSSLREQQRLLRLQTSLTAKTAVFCFKFCLF